MKHLAYVATIAAVTLFGLSLSVEAAEKHKQSGRNTFEHEISRTTSAIADTAGHQLVHATSIFSQSSSDLDFQGTVIRDFNQADEVNGTGKSRGYSDQTHKNGDKTYWQYEGSHKTMTKADGSWETTTESRYWALGGTGKFKALKGGGTATCRFTVEGGYCDWKGEHEY
jgi:hypothetical protein